jgi:hypothetical protein
MINSLVCKPHAGTHVTKTVTCTEAIYRFFSCNDAASVAAVKVFHHNGMALPQVTDAGDGLYIWRLVANLLNKQQQTTKNGDPAAWGLDVGLTTPHLKK